MAAPLSVFLYACVCVCVCVCVCFESEKRWLVAVVVWRCWWGRRSGKEWRRPGPESSGTSWTRRARNRPTSCSVRSSSARRWRNGTLTTSTGTTLSSWPAKNKSQYSLTLSLILVHNDSSHTHIWNARYVFVNLSQWQFSFSFSFFWGLLWLSASLSLWGFLILVNELIGDIKFFPPSGLWWTFGLGDWGLGNAHYLFILLSLWLLGFDVIVSVFKLVGFAYFGEWIEWWHKVFFPLKYYSFWSVMGFGGWLLQGGWWVPFAEFCHGGWWAPPVLEVECGGVDNNVGCSILRYVSSASTAQH